jgi:hypothetical protein
VALVVLTGVSIASAPALAGPGSDPQKASDSAAATYEEAQVRVGELDGEIRQLEQKIVTLRARRSDELSARTRTLARALTSSPRATRRSTPPGTRSCSTRPTRATTTP